VRQGGAGRGSGFARDRVGPAGDQLGHGAPRGKDALGTAVRCGLSMAVAGRSTPPTAAVSSALRISPRVFGCFSLSRDGNGSTRTFVVLRIAFLSLGKTTFRPAVQARPRSRRPTTVRLGRCGGTFRSRISVHVGRTRQRPSTGGHPAVQAVDAFLRPIVGGAGPLGAGYGARCRPLSRRRRRWRRSGPTRASPRASPSR
jgi:hypothetical protein